MSVVETDRLVEVERVCACGCGESLDGRRPNVRYVDRRHRRRAWAEGVGYEDRRAARRVRNASGQFVEVDVNQLGRGVRVYLPSVSEAERIADRLASVGEADAAARIRGAPSASANGSAHDLETEDGP